MSLQPHSQSPSKALMVRPSHWIAAMTLCAAAAVAWPTVQDWSVRQAPTRVAMMDSSSQAFFSFDWGGLWDQVSSAISSWIGDMQGVKQAIVASKEKQDVALNQLTQAELNYEAALALAKASQDTVDKVASERIDACQVMEETKANQDSAKDASMEARANTAYTVSKTLHVPNSTKVLAQRLTGSFGDYCSPESLQRGHCPSGVVSPKNMPDADIQATSILGTQDSQSQTLSEDEHDAATRYVQWVTDPVPIDDLPVASEKTQVGKLYLTEKRKRAAIASAAQFSMNKIIASRWVRN